MDIDSEEEFEKLKTTQYYNIRLYYPPQIVYNKMQNTINIKNHLIPAGAI